MAALTTSDVKPKDFVEAHIELTEDNDPKAHGEPDLDAGELKRLWRKIDVRLIPIMAVVYSFSVIDRINIGQVCCLPSTPNLSCCSLTLRRQEWSGCPQT